MAPANVKRRRLVQSEDFLGNLLEELPTIVKSLEFRCPFKCSAEYLFDLMNPLNMKPTSADSQVSTHNGETGLPATNEAMRIIVHSKNKVMSIHICITCLSQASEEC